MADSRMRIAIFHEGSSFQVRVTDYTGKDIKLLKEKLNLDDAKDALLRMEDYDDLRSDEYFEAGDGKAKTL